MTPQYFAPFIVLIREKSRWTQSELAQHLDVSVRTVARWEKGDSVSKQVDHLVKLIALGRQHLPDDDPALEMIATELSRRASVEDMNKNPKLWMNATAGAMNGSTLAGLAALAGVGSFGIAGAMIGGLAASAMASFRRDDDKSTTLTEQDTIALLEHKRRTARQRLVQSTLERAADQLDTSTSEYIRLLLPVLEAALSNGWALDEFMTHLYTHDMEEKKMT